MDESAGLDLKNEYLIEFSRKFPELNTQIIKRAINDYNCDYDKVNDCLLSITYQNSCNIRKRSSESSGKNQSLMSFVSLDSSSSSPAPSRNNDRNSVDLNTVELSIISHQNFDFKRLVDAFKGMERNRNYLEMEMEYLKEVYNRRKSFPDFPNVIEVEELEKDVNQKFKILPKAISYANDLRRPDEMNNRYKGFQHPFTQNIDKDVNKNNNNEKNSQRKENFSIHNLLNPNFYLTPKLKNQFLSPFRKKEEKRNSAHLVDNYQLPEELTGHKPVHHRQKSDPWISDTMKSGDENFRWICSRCLENNTSLICSFCCLEKFHSERP